MAAQRQPARATSRRKPSREAERRKTIMRAAVEVFSRKGYHGCRIADVAREAGVAYGLVYHYFQDKDELLQSVFESGWAGFLDRVRHALGQDVHFAERVRAVVHVAFEAYRRDHRAVKVLILEVGRSPSGGAVNRGDAFTQIIAAAAEMFRGAQARGELSSTLDPTLCATMLFGAIEMGLTAFILGLLDRRDEDAIRRARDQVAESFLKGVVGAGSALSPAESRPWTEPFATASKAGQPG